MDASRFALLLGSISSFFVTLLHIALAIRPEKYRYFNASELADMHEVGSPFTLLVTIGLVVMFASWGFYGLSGAGVIRQLPLLRAVLIAIGSIYILRSFMLPSEMIKFLQTGHSFRFIILSIGSLVFGIFYLYGTLAR